MSKIKLLLSSYFLVILALFFYSFTQVDLSLTLSKISIWQIIEKNFQYLGFFQRPTSTIIFTLILILMIIFYALFLYLSLKNKISPKNLLILVVGSFLILVFSYNAFSYDLFNYIFDAKILTFYHQNPFLHKPSDFIGDPMLNFMRWTHRVYPYGISWLSLTVPLSFIGLNFFLPTLLMFKLLMGLSYLGSCYLIYKISEKLFSKNKIINTLFFALNPLVLIEGLVSAHNDMPMVFITLLSFYFYLNKKALISSFLYIFSIGIKYATAVLLLPAIYIYLMDKLNKKINWERVFVFSVMFSLIAVLFATLRTNFQPWYFVFSLSLAAFVSRKYYIFIPATILSIFSVLTYIPYVYLTDYGKGYPELIAQVQLIGLIFAFFMPFAYSLFKKIR